MSLADLIIDLHNAKTPDDKEQAYAAFDKRKAAQPSDAEVLTAFLRECTNMAGKPLLQADEYAALAGDKVEVKKLN
jgi:hypothetical protein